MECNVHFAIQISQWHKKSSQNHSKNNLWLCILKIKFTKIKMRLHDKKNKKKIDCIINCKMILVWNTSVKHTNPKKHKGCYFCVCLCAYIVLKEWMNFVMILVFMVFSLLFVSQNKETGLSNTFVEKGCKRHVATRDYTRDNQMCIKLNKKEGWLFVWIISWLKRLPLW